MVRTEREISRPRTFVDEKLLHPAEQQDVQGQHPSVADERHEDKYPLRYVQQIEEHTLEMADDAGRARHRLCEERTHDRRTQSEKPGEPHHCGHAHIKYDVRPTRHLLDGAVGVAFSQGGFCTFSNPRNVDDCTDEKDTIDDKDEQDGRAEGYEGGQRVGDPTSSGLAVHFV